MNHNLPPAETIPPARNYQLACVSIALRAFAEGVKRQVVHMATGLGKTRTMAELIKRISGTRKRRMILAHREELIHQTADDIRLINPNLSVEVEQADNWASDTAGVIIGSVATLGRVDEKHDSGFSHRLRRFNPADFDFLCIDECLTGDAMVITDVGEIRLEEVPSSGATRILTLSGNQITNRPITNFFTQGARDVWEVELESGQTIQATANHPFFTNEGWIPLEKLKPGFHLVITVNADAEKSHREISGEGIIPTSKVIVNTGKKVTWNGKKILKAILKMRPFAYVVAEKKRLRHTQHYPDLNMPVGVGNILVTSSDMTKDQGIGICHSQKKSVRQYWERFLETLVYYSPINEARTQGFALTTQLSNVNGLSTNASYSKDSICESLRVTMGGMGKRSSDITPVVFRQLEKFSPLRMINLAKKDLLNAGLTALGILEWLGGYVTMGLVMRVERALRFTPLVFQRKSTNSCASGLAKNTVRHISAMTRGDINFSIYQPLQSKKLSQELPSTSHCACDTKLVGISKIRYAGNKRVFDISVDGTHCFFANGILVHNCHHSAGSTYRRILDYFGTANPMSPILLWGCTATVRRSDGVGLDDLFDQIVFSKGTLEGIEEGYLTTIRAIRIQTTTTLEGVGGSGDWNEEELGDRVNNPTRNRAIFDAWKEHVEGRRKATTIFCVNVAHIYAIEEVFRKNGVYAIGVDGQTKDDVRQRVVADYKAGKIPVLINCGLFTEGTNMPITDAMIMARPTKSSVLFQQIIGRGIRLYPGKEDCLIIDIVDACSGKSLMTVPSLFGLRPDFDAKGEDMVKTYRQMEKMLEENPAIVRAESVEHASHMTSERIDLMQVGYEDDVIREASQFKWRRVDDRYFIDLASGRALEIRQDVLGKYNVLQHDKMGCKAVAQRADLTAAINAADGHIRDFIPDAIALIDRHGQWRNDPMSPTQIGFFQRNKMTIPLDSNGHPTITRDQAGEMIKARLAQYAKWGASKQKRKAKKEGIKTKMDDVKVGKL